MIVLESNTYFGLGADGVEAWRGFLRAHGIDPGTVAFPMMVDDDLDPPQMHLRILLRNDQGMRYLNPDGEVATRPATVIVQHPIPSQRPNP